MDLALDETAPAVLTCPLCHSAVAHAAGPRTTQSAMATLGSHFGSACPATAFTVPRAA